MVPLGLGHRDSWFHCGQTTVLQGAKRSAGSGLVWDQAAPLASCTSKGLLKELRTLFDVQGARWCLAATANPIPTSKLRIGSERPRWLAVRWT